MKLIRKNFSTKSKLMSNFKDKNGTITLKIIMKMTPFNSFRKGQ